MGQIVSNRDDFVSQIPLASGGVTRLEGRRSYFAIFMGVLIAAAVTLALGMSAASAQSEETYTLSGTVTDADGDPLSGMTVSVFCSNCPDGSHTDPDGDPARPWPVGGTLLWEGKSDESGNWSATATPASRGRSRVFAWDPERDYGYASLDSYYWDNLAELDLRMSHGGFLSGRLMSDGQPPPASADVRYSLRSRPVLGLIVSADGDYSTPGLPNGRYYVSQEGLPLPYIDGFFDLLGEISGGENAVVDHELTQFGLISGEVTDGTGKGLGGIIISYMTPPGAVRYEYDGKLPPSGGGIVTDDTGYFGTVYSEQSRGGGLGLIFRDPNGAYASTTTSVRVGPKEKVELSIQLWLASRISGRVLDRQGLPVQNYYVEVCRLVDDNEDCYWLLRRWQQISVSSTGVYEATGFVPGTHVVKVSHYQTSTDLSSELELTEDSSHQVDFVINDGGRMSGLVTDANGAPIPGVSVGFQEGIRWGYYRTVQTGVDGSYLSPLLAAGNYTLSLRPFSFSMEPVAVVDGETTSTNATLDVGYIEGTVTSGGVLLPDATVRYSGPTGGRTSTGADGTYRVAVSAGDYTVDFSTSWHESARYKDSRGAVNVVSASTTSGIDADLTEKPGPGPPTPPPEGTQVEGASSEPGRIPNFLSTDTLTMEHQGCPNGFAHLRIGRQGFEMSEDPSGSGLYSVSVPIIQMRIAGRVDVQISVRDCEDPDDAGSVSFNIYIDPSGVVQDQHGNPIAGTVVTLLRDNPETSEQDFEAVADGSAVMDPRVNNTNPDVTGSDGLFRWDVVSGWWKVRAEAAGCHAPGDEGTAFVETDGLYVPPPRFGLVLELECGTSESGGVYSDISGGHVPSIEALDAEGLLEGTECGPGRFCPRDGMKRWTMAVWLVRVLDDSDPGPITTSRFEDVDPDQWWAPYVERLAEHGVTMGCSREPALFCPDQTVPREQMATFLVRAFELEAASPAGFVDTGGSSHAANIDALAAARITIGCSLDPLKFCPEDRVTRAEMATFLARALGLVRVP